MWPADSTLQRCLQPSIPRVRCPTDRVILQCDLQRVLPGALYSLPRDADHSLRDRIVKKTSALAWLFWTAFCLVGFFCFVSVDVCLFFV